MGKKGMKMEPLSLAQHFDAPEDFLGSFGWVCGYSADELFLDDAVERFSRQTKDQRRAEGRINLAVMLDSGNAQIKMTDVPGVAHLPIRSGIKKKFQLMHAKVALLGFRKISDGSQWRLRLIVSTGNWTKQTIEDSLDLVWRIDFNCEDLAIKSDEVKQIQSDFTAAWGFIEELKESYDLRVLEGGQRKDKSVSGSEPKRQLDDWIKRVLRKPRQPSSRFFDNRKKSFLGQLPKMIERIGTKPTRRNYIAFGSGFYEESDAGTGVPSVLASIVKKMSVDNAILTKGAKKDVFVNPNACQSIAKSHKSLSEKGFCVRPAVDPCDTEDKGDERSLHAKFLFSANKRKDSKKFTSVWIYLGSGNLTKPGFAMKASSGGGNLEAGVVFGPGEQLYSARVNSGSQQHVVSNFLPIQFKDYFADGELAEGGEYVPRDQNAFVSPLIPYLLWEKEGDTALLKRPPSGNDETTLRVFNNTGKPCPQRDAGCFVWGGEWLVLWR